MHCAAAGVARPAARTAKATRPTLLLGMWSLLNKGGLQFSDSIPILRSGKRVTAADNRLALDPLQYCVRRFFADHINRAQDEQTGDARKNRRVHDSQPLRSVNLEIARQHAPICGISDGAST